MGSRAVGVSDLVISLMQSLLVEFRVLGASDLVISLMQSLLVRSVTVAHTVAHLGVLACSQVLATVVLALSVAVELSVALERSSLARGALDTQAVGQLAVPSLAA